MKKVLLWLLGLCVGVPLLFFIGFAIWLYGTPSGKAFDSQTQMSAYSTRVAVEATYTPTPIPSPTPAWVERVAGAETIEYKTLFRHAEDYVGRVVTYKGKVVQVIEKRGDFQLRVNVTQGEYGHWDDTILLLYDDAPTRILKGDVIEFVGQMLGVHTYESIFGQDISIPFVQVHAVQIEGE